MEQGNRGAQGGNRETGVQPWNRGTRGDRGRTNVDDDNDIDDHVDHDENNDDDDEAITMMMMMIVVMMSQRPSSA